MKDRQRALTPVLTGALCLTIGLVWWPAFRFPYVRDDWFSLSLVHDLSLDGLLRFLSFPHQQWFRPLGTAYLWLNYQLFGFDSAGFHAFDLLLHACSSLLVVGVALRLGAGFWASWAAGFLYAAAVTVQLDPLLWASGIYDLGGSVFFFLSLWLFLGNRNAAALFAFIIALLFKESTVVLPVVLLAHVLFMGQGRESAAHLRSGIGRLLGFGLITVVYVFYVMNTRGVPFARPEDHPYQMSTLGMHLWENLTHYATWSFEAVAPFVPRFSEAHAVTIGTALILASSAILIASLARNRNPEHPGAEATSRLGLFLGSWWLIGLLPALLLSNHLYRYYLIYSLPAVLIGLSCLAQAMGKRALGTQRGGHAVLALGVAACILGSGAYFWNRAAEGNAQQYTFGTNSLIAMATTVKQVRGGLDRMHPTLPTGSHLVFLGLQPWAFGYRAGPSLWYADKTLEVYAPSELGRDTTGLYFKNASPRRYLDPDRTFFFTLRDGELVETQPKALRGVR